MRGIVRRLEAVLAPLYCSPTSGPMSWPIQTTLGGSARYKFARSFSGSASTRDARTPFETSGSATSPPETCATSPPEGPSSGAGPPSALAAAPVGSTGTAAAQLESHMAAVRMAEDIDGIFFSPETLKRIYSPYVTASSCLMPDYRLPHVLWTSEALRSQHCETYTPQNRIEWWAYRLGRGLANAVSWSTGYSMKSNDSDERAVLRRLLLMESIMAIPSVVGALNRHLRSCRRMQPDRGWIHTMWEEAENIRVHVLAASLIYQPPLLMKVSLRVVQSICVPLWSMFYAASPRFAFRLNAFLGEESFQFYSEVVKQIDDGELPGLEREAPLPICRYYQFESATLREMLLAFRADANRVSQINHTFADLPRFATNPFPPPI